MRTQSGTPVAGAFVVVKNSNGVIRGENTTAADGTYTLFSADSGFLILDALGAGGVSMLASPVSLFLGAPLPCPVVKDLTIVVKCPAEKSECTHPVTQQQQCDPACNSDFLDGSSYKMASSGCYVACVAMIVGSNPCNVNIELSITGGIDSEGDVVGATAADNYFLQFESSGKSDAEIEAGLCKGQVLARVCSPNSSGNHTVVVTGQIYDAGLKKCRFKVVDPYNGCGGISYSYLDEYPCVQGTRRYFK